MRFSFRGSRPCSRFYEKHADMPCQGAQYCIQGCFQHSGTPGLLRYIDSLTILSSRARAARLSNTRISALSKLLFQVGAFPKSMGLKAQSFRAGVRGWRFLSFNPFCWEQTTSKANSDRTEHSRLETGGKRDVRVKPLRLAIASLSHRCVLPSNLACFKKEWIYDKDAFRRH